MKDYIEHLKSHLCKHLHGHTLEMAILMSEEYWKDNSHPEDYKDSILHFIDAIEWLAEFEDIGHVTLYDWKIIYTLAQNKEYEKIKLLCDEIDIRASGELISNTFHIAEKLEQKYKNSKT